MDEAEKWLRENDPDYGNKKKLDNPYHTKRQEFLRRQKEIPTSSIGKYQNDKNFQGLEELKKLID